MIIKKIIATTLAIFALLIISVILLLYSQKVTIDLSSYRQFLDSKMSSLLAQPIYIKGPIQLRLSFQPTIQISNIEIINPKKSSETQLFTIPSVIVSFDLMQLSHDDWMRLISMTAVVPADIHINFVDAQLSVRGTILYQDKLENFNVDFELQGQRFKQINFFSDASMDDVGPFQLQGKLSLDQKRIALNILKGHVAASTFFGKCSYDPNTPRPNLLADIEIDEIDLNTFLPLEPSAKDDQIAAIFTYGKIFDIDLNLRIGKIINQYRPISQVSLNTAIYSGKTRDTQFNLLIDEVPLTGFASFDFNDLINKAGGNEQAKVFGTISLTASNQELTMSGTLVYPSAVSNASINLALRGKQLEDLAALTEFPLPKLKDYALRAELAIANNIYKFTQINAHTVNSQIKGDFTLDINKATPIIKSNLSIDKIRFNDFDTETQSTNEKLLVTYLDYVNLDVDLKIDSISTPTILIQDFSIRGNLTDKKIEALQFQFKAGPSYYQGNAFANAQLAVPEVSLNMNAKNFNLANLFANKTVLNNYNAQSPQVDLALKSQGDTWQVLVNNMNIKLTSSSADITYKPADGTKPRLLTAKDITLKTLEHEIVLDANGSVEGTPIQVHSTMDRPTAMRIPTQPLDIVVSLRTNDTSADVKFVAALPFDWRQQNYTVELQGKQLASLNTITQRTLPAIGPYTFSAQVNFPAEGIRLSNAYATVSESVIDGEATYLYAAHKPSIRGNISSKYLVLDSLAPLPQTSKKQQKSITPKDDQSTIPVKSAKPITTFLSTLYTALSATAVDFTVTVKNLVTVDMRIDEIDIGIKSDDTSISIDPVNIVYSDGKMTGQLNFSTLDNQITTEFRAQIEKFDYGLLSPYLVTNGKSDGIVNADIELHNTNASIEQMVETATGHINVVIWPDTGGGYLLDAWGEGILRSTLNTFIPSLEHKFNCIVGYFDVADGIMSSKALLIDTNRVSIIGNGQIDLAKRSIDLIMRPKSKSTQIVENQVPMSIKGKWNQYSIKPNRGYIKGGVIDSIVRMPTSIITFPYRAMIQKDIPTSGEIACESK